MPIYSYRCTGGVFVRARCEHDSRVMLRNVLVQSSYQLAITLYLVYAGERDFGINDEYLGDHGFSCTPTKYLGTFVFNSFVLCQVCHD